MKLTRYMLLMLTLIISVSMRGQYDPANPSEPGEYYKLTLAVTPNGAGSFNINNVTTQIPGTNVRLRAYNNTNFTFIAWELNGEVISTSDQFDYTMPQRDVTLIAHYKYDPSNPTEPSAPEVKKYSKLFLNSSPKEGGSFNISSGNRYEVGSSVYVRAYTSSSNFKFVNWTENGEVISTSDNFNYVIKENDSYLIANFRYDPSNPNEPSEPRLMHTLYLVSYPSGGGTFNVGSGNKYQEGSTISLRAYNNNYYSFKNWTIGDSVISTNYQISYIMPTHDVTLQANYTYDYSPSNPNEPGQPGAHVAIYGMTEDGIRGQTIQYPILVENTNKPIKGIVVDAQFPEGFTVNKDGIAISSRASGHTLGVVELGNNNYRLSVKGDAQIEGDNGKLLEIPVAIPDTAVMGKTYPVKLTHGVLIGIDDSQTPISVRSGGILIERISEDGLYARFSFDKYQNRVLFKNNSSSKATRFEWDFGDGQKSTEEAPLHVYSQSGSYVVKLTAYGEVDADVAEMNVFINEPSTWTAQGTYTLASSLNNINNNNNAGVRCYTSMSELMKMLETSTITGDIYVQVESGKSFNYDLSSEHIQQIRTLAEKLSSKDNFILFEKYGEDHNPEILIGSNISDYNSSTMDVLLELGRHEYFKGIELKLWGVSFDMNHLHEEFSQTVCSAINTTPVDFSLISRDLVFKVKVDNPPVELPQLNSMETRVLPSICIVNNSDGQYDIVFHIVGYYQDKEFYSFDYHIFVNPALIGLFGNMSPLDGALLEKTDVTLTWENIANASYDVYLWNAQNQAPTQPVAENIKEMQYTSSRFCTYGNTYKWYVKAHNECHELVSDTLSFSIESLPDLHIYSLDCSEVEGDGKITVQYNVKNDGQGSTGTIRWNEYIWLVQDVYTGTSGTGSKLLKTVENLKALAPGESYDASVEVELPKHTYGNYYLLVAADMYNVTNIEWNAIGGSIILPYNPTQDGSGYKHLYASTSPNYNKVYEQEETDSRSDNFFYKKIEIAVPNLADLQVTKIEAKPIAGQNPTLGQAAPALIDMIVPDYDPNVIIIGVSGTEVAQIVQMLSPSPLTAAGLRLSDGFYCGKFIYVTATVENMGGVPTEKSFRTVLYMSKSADRDASPLIPISGVTFNGSISSDKRLEINYLVPMPYEWIGDTYFHAYADIDDNVFELSNTVNNWGVSDRYDCLAIPSADFKPSELKAPKNITANVPFNISYKVENVGAGVPYNPLWQDKIYLSKKSNGLDESAICIGTIPQFGRFEYVIVGTTDGPPPLIYPEEYWYVGDNYTSNREITLPNIEPGKYYLYLKVDADDSVMEIGGEDDNVICSGEVICTAPDIEIELIGLSSEVAKSEENLALTWKVKNTGSGDIQNASLTDAFYASINQDGADAMKITEVSNVVSVAAGQEKTLHANITIPKTERLDGVRYVFMRSNIDNKIKEISSGNNQSTIQKMTFEYVADPLPPVVKGTDITIKTIEAPASVKLGEEFKMNLVVTNQGENTVNKEVSYKVSIKGSGDPEQGIECEATHTQGSVVGLITNSSVNIGLKVKVPSDIRGGSKSLIVHIDPENILGEKRPYENIRSVSINIEGNQPNLILEDAECPETITTSTPTDISFVCKNAGTWTAGSSKIVVYLSKNSTLNNQAITLATIPVRSLQSGEGQALKSSISIADKNTGKWYIILVADIENRVTESDEKDNMLTIPVEVVSAPLPDLTPRNLSTDEVLRMGNEMTIKSTVYNVGSNATRQNRWTDTYYLSTSLVLNPQEAIMLGSKTRSGILEKEAYYTNEVKFTIPTNAKGNYMLFVVTDASDAITEENENNNQLSIPVYVNSEYDRPADLVVTNVSAPAKIMAGQNTTIEYTITNNGEFTAHGELSDVIYLSKDNQWDSNDIMVGITTGNATINPGASLTRQATGRITNTVEGDYYVIVRTNSTRTIAEQNLTNNTMVQKSPSSVRFEEITLDGSTALTTSGYYKINVSSMTENKTLGFYLDHPEDAQAGLYVSYEKVPTTAVFDKASSSMEETRQEVLVSKVQNGNYYILAQANQAVINADNNKFYLDGMPKEKSVKMSLQSKIVNFGATSFSINEGGSGGWISSEVRGALFDSIMDFRLELDKVVIPAESVTYKDQTSSRVTFNLNNAQVGTYDVVSELPDGNVATLPNGFRVIPGASIGLGIKLDVPGVVRQGSYAPISISYSNGGTTDIEIAELLLVIDQGYLGEDIKDLDRHQSALHIKPDFGADNRGFISIPPGTHRTLNLYMYQIATSSTITIYIVK